MILHSKQPRWSSASNCAARSSNALGSMGTVAEIQQFSSSNDPVRGELAQIRIQSATQ